MNWLLTNKIVRGIIIIVVVIAVLWLACIVIEKLGGYFHIGGGVGNSGANFHIGEQK